MHLAQINVATMRYPLDDDRMAGFVDRLDEINALAEASRGFVWRLQTDDGDATALRVFGDERVLINLSVWEAVDALRTFTYRSTHRHLLQGRRAWFFEHDEPHLALWWVPEGHTPDIDEAKMRLSHLREHGPTPASFTLRETFDPIS